jgi:hypothetical protein
MLTDRLRTSTAHPKGTYDFHNYFAYALYPPLYIAGPIMTFNDFMWQVHRVSSGIPPSPNTLDPLKVRRPLTISSSFKINYLIRFVISLLTMEFVLHFMYVVAIKDAKAWEGDTPFELAMIGFWNLIVMWLKVRYLTTMVMHLSVSNFANVVAYTLEVFSIMGYIRWDGSSRKYGSLCGEQLFNAWILAKLASEL